MLGSLPIRRGCRHSRAEWRVAHVSRNGQSVERECGPSTVNRFRGGRVWAQIANGRLPRTRSNTRHRALKWIRFSSIPRSGERLERNVTQFKGCSLRPRIRRQPLQGCSGSCFASRESRASLEWPAWSQYDPAFKSGVAQSRRSYFARARILRSVPPKMLACASGGTPHTSSILR